MGTYPAAVGILVDDAVWPWRGRLWAHLVSDTSHDELHEFAARLGMPRRAFQGDHYDLPTDLRERAVAIGAEPVCARELLHRLTTAGLRRPKRRRSPPEADQIQVAPPVRFGAVDAVPRNGLRAGNSPVHSPGGPYQPVRE